MSALFSLETVYVLTGLLLWAFAALTPRPGARLFWFLFGVIFCFGGVMPHHWTGALVVVMVILDGAGQVKPIPLNRDEERPEPLGNSVFLPVLTIPALTVLGAAVSLAMGANVSRGALLGLGYGGVAATLLGVRLFRSDTRTLLEEGHRINDTMGAVTILPQLLASLGLVFTAAGVGDVIAGGIQRMVSHDALLWLVVANCAGMMLFTLVMGNSFAAFPVIASGITVPLIVKPFGVDPSLAAILTLTAGSTGTLMTPMAANFNIVPTALLAMKDTNGVIRFQIPFALVMGAGHVLLLYGLIRLTGS